MVTSEKSIDPMKNTVQILRLKAKPLEGILAVPQYILARTLLAIEKAR